LNALCCRRIALGSPLGGLFSCLEESHVADLFERLWPRIRDVALFILGAAVIVHETMIADQPDPTLVMFAAGAMGLPFVMRRDEKPQAKPPAVYQGPTDEPPSGMALAVATYPRTTAWLLSTIAAGMGAMLG
jgi:hypothetical protein